MSGLIPPLAISLGDPAGIGPEIVAKAWMGRQVQNLPPFFAIGNAASLSAVWPGPLERVETPADATSVFERALPLLPLGGSSPVEPGKPSLEGAATSMEALEAGIGLVRNGAASALVTAPVSKAQLYKVGFQHPGQTEYIAESCGYNPDHAVMLLAGRALRVVPVTIHMPLRDVPDALTIDRIVTQTRIAAKGLDRDLGVTNPRIAVAGLNPHAGEDGALGDEEQRIIAPAIALLKAEGLRVTGPFPPDALFTERMRETYDLAMCMYHDQALIPLKALHFDDGVNMTLGLPIIRTSPDHGTAFGIAGTNQADPSAMIAAISMASRAAHLRALLA